MSIAQQVDLLLNETSWLLFGCQYEVLDSLRQSTVLAEACCRFTSAQLEAGDNARKAAREAA